MPNSQAIIDKTADAYFNQGVLGATVVLLLLLLVVAGLVIRTLYRDNQACHGVALEDRRDLIKAVEASRDMSERLRDLLQSMQATLETRGQTVSDLSHQVGITAQKVEHGLGNLGASLDAIARWIDRQRDRGEDRARQRADDLDRGRP